MSIAKPGGRFSRPVRSGLVGLILLAVSGAAQQAIQPPRPEPVLDYIRRTWTVLTRSNRMLAKAAVDPKFHPAADGRWPVYVPRTADLGDIQAQLRKEMPAADFRTIELRVLPQEPAQIRDQGLLYLPRPYVVPGGRFNEMYGWDSYFIIRGLLRENRIDLAKGMVENFFFEIENYGGVLNANRTYYLTRSQPPFLSSMVLAVYEAQTKQGQSDLHWLERAYGSVIRDYEQWNQPPHLAGETGLSRYFDLGEGPVPEIMGDPSHYYRGVANFFLIHEGAKSSHLIALDARNTSPNIVGPAFPIYVCDSNSDALEVPRCAPPDQVALTADFYEGDRSMRESGFDVSFRFGPFGAETHHYAPVCLNSLLYKTEKDLEKMASILGREHEAQNWRKKALERNQRIVKYLWDSSRGLFFDYDFMTRKRSSYEYATTFYPLWAGLASHEQAYAVTQNLPLFEQPGGIAMSRRDTQAQWDYPYGWAPIQLLAVEGLRRYGYAKQADRIAFNFLDTVLRNFTRDGTIREKYDVTTESSETHIGAGYAQNVIGFGWTNGVFLELLSQLPPEMAARLNQPADPSKARSEAKSGEHGKVNLDATPQRRREAKP